MRHLTEAIEEAKRTDQHPDPRRYVGLWLSRLAEPEVWARVRDPLRLAANRTSPPPKKARSKLANLIVAANFGPEFVGFLSCAFATRIIASKTPTVSPAVAGETL